MLLPLQTCFGRGEELVPLILGSGETIFGQDGSRRNGRETFKING